LTYRQPLGDHTIAAGLKGRIKKLDSINIEGEGEIPLTFDDESIYSLFFQDQYALSEQELLTFGISYNRIDRNGQIENDDLLQLRLGYIHTDEHWSYKAYLYRIMFALDPLNRSLQDSLVNNVLPQVTVGHTQEISYSDKKQRIRLLLHWMRDEDTLLQNSADGFGGDTKYFTSIFNYDYSFDRDNKAHLQLYYAHYQDIFNLDKLEDISGYFSFSNEYNAFHFYNGLVWHQNSIDWKHYFDLTSVISWNLSESLTFTVKGDNILDKAKKTKLFRVDPSAGSLLTPLNVSPVDRRLTVELEYAF
jgi:hypothetical protein